MIAIVKDIPIQTGITHYVNEILINLTNKTAYFPVVINNIHYHHLIDLMPIINAATTTQKNVIKGFIKQIVANAVDVDVSNITDDILD